VPFSREVDGKNEMDGGDESGRSRENRLIMDRDRTRSFVKRKQIFETDRTLSSALLMMRIAECANNRRLWC